MLVTSKYESNSPAPESLLYYELDSISLPDV